MTGDKPSHVAQLILVVGLLEPFSVQDRASERIDIVGSHLEKSFVVSWLQAVAKLGTELEKESLPGTLALSVAGAHLSIVQLATTEAPEPHGPGAS